MSMRLKIKIRKLQDGRFKVFYYWHWWELNKEYFKDAKEVSAFIEQLVTQTKWS